MLAVKQGESTSPARAAGVPGDPQSPKKGPETRQPGREHTPEGAANRRPYHPKGSPVFIEASRRLGSLAGHQRAPKALRTHRTRVAPVEVGRAIFWYAAVVGVRRHSDMDALAVHINVAARLTAAAIFVRRAANDVEAPRLLESRRDLRARFQKTVLYGTCCSRRGTTRNPTGCSGRTRLSNKGPPQRTTTFSGRPTPRVARGASAPQNALHTSADPAVGGVRRRVQRFVFLGGRRDAASIRITVDDGMRIMRAAGPAHSEGDGPRVDRARRKLRRSEKRKGPQTIFHRLVPHTTKRGARPSTITEHGAMY